ncbi:EAL domain-containing protein [Sulfurimonas sp.]
MKKDNDNKIKYELMELMASDSFASSFAFLIIISVVTLVFWGPSDKIFLSVWTFCLYGIIFIRTFFIKQFLKNKINFNAIYLIFHILTILSVALLSIGLMLIFPRVNELYQAFIVMIIAGTSAGAVMTLSYFKNLSISYLLILIFPLIYTLFRQNSDILHALNYLVILFLIMALLFSIKYNKTIITTLKNKNQILKTKKALEVSKNNFESIFKEVPVGLFTYNEKLVITQANKALATFLQAPVEKLIGLDMKTLKDKVFLQELEKVFLNEKVSYEGKYHTTLANVTIWIKLNAIPMYDTQGNISSGLGMVEDITQQVEYQEQLKYHAFYDSLTGLTNRNAFTGYLQKFMHRLERTKEYGILLFIDLDNFKNINDSLGHDVGDYVLKIFAQRIKKVLRKGDIFARLGGDEFVILIFQTESNPIFINEIALNISNKIHEALKEPIQSDTETLYITLSLGIKTLQSDEKDVNTILKHADIAMYESKNSGKNKTSFYDAAMSEQMQRQLTLHNELKTAIKEKQFELYLQPIVDLKTDKIVSAEALIRWNHPTKGLIFPDAFIDYAETSNLIIEIGNWVIDRAFEMFHELNHTLEDIAVNISLKQFYQNDFEDILLNNAKKYNLHPSCIKLELTESVTLKNLDDTVNKMLAIKSHGFKFSMDDFGTGYSSLSYLKNLPFDYLKIDQSFVINMLKNESDKKLVKIIIDVAQQFNFLVIAEGVETSEHVKFMQENKCDFYQGYFMSKPIPIQKFKTLLS